MSQELFDKFIEDMSGLKPKLDTAERIKLVKRYLADMDEENRQKRMKKFENRSKMADHRVESLKRI